MKIGLTEGYYLSEGFSTRPSDYESPRHPPEGYADAEEDSEEYESATDDYIFRTTDGKFFVNYDKAKAYQDTLVIPELDEVLELLEKVKVLCETNKSKSPVLETIKDAVSKIEKDGGEHLMAKYYDSTCW